MTKARIDIERNGKTQLAALIQRIALAGGADQAVGDSISLLLRLYALRSSQPGLPWPTLFAKHSSAFQLDAVRMQLLEADLEAVDELIVQAESAAQALSCLYETLLSLVQSKKRSGSFYTPPHLVSTVVQHALEPLTNVGDLLQLRIVDPAMGAGVFLIQAYQYLEKRLSAKEKSEFARCCLYGVDLDPLAVEVAKLSLWLIAGDWSLNPYEDFPNLRVGNSLIGCRPDQVEKNEKPELDRWCAEWFAVDSESIDEIAKRYKFFHWQYEFSDVFDKRGGFDAVIGNPPWEIEKPNSREFFGSVDPSYWTLGKQEALSVQQDLLNDLPEVNALWQARKREHSLFSRWIKKAPIQLDSSIHPFIAQGSGDLNLYKLFSEQAFYLAREGGKIALLVPSGIYSDCGARELRRLLLQNNSWSHLMRFENSDGAFDIHRSFKYCAVIVTKGGRTERLNVSSREKTTQLDVNSILKLSPKWSVLAEVESELVLNVLERIYDSSQLLGDTEYGGARLNYSRELDMTLDSHLFRGRDALEAQGFIQDVYGNWLSGGWCSHTSQPDDATHGVIASACGKFAITTEKVSEVFVPLYEGRMVGQFTANEKHWIHGKGRRAVWNKPAVAGIGPQYLVSKEVLRERCEESALKIGFLAVGCATNARTMISACLSRVACGNSVPVLTIKSSAAGRLTSSEFLLALNGLMNSFVFDFVIRRKMAGNNLNYFVIEECPLPRLNSENVEVWKRIAHLVARISFSHIRYCDQLLQLGYKAVPRTNRKVRAQIDVLVASLYGLNEDDMRLILSDDHPINSKGFFRVDRDLPEEERLPALVLKQMTQAENIGPWNIELESSIDEHLAAHAALLDELIIGSPVLRK